MHLRASQFPPNPLDNSSTSRSRFRCIALKGWGDGPVTNPGWPLTYFLNEKAAIEWHSFGLNTTSMTMNVPTS